MGQEPIQKRVSVEGCGDILPYRPRRWSPCLCAGRNQAHCRLLRRRIRPTNRIAESLPNLPVAFRLGVYGYAVTKGLSPVTSGTRPPTERNRSGTRLLRAGRIRGRRSVYHSQLRCRHYDRRCDARRMRWRWSVQPSWRAGTRGRSSSGPLRGRPNNMGRRASRDPKFSDRTGVTRHALRDGHSGSRSPHHHSSSGSGGFALRPLPKV